MNAERTVGMLMLIGVLALAMTLSLPRPAHAGDAGKIIAAVVAGAIVYELLDDDDDGRVYRRPPRGRAYRPYEGRYGYAPYGGYGGWEPAPQVYRPPARYCEPARSEVRIDVRRGRHGSTSVGFGYRDRRW